MCSSDLFPLSVKSALADVGVIDAEDYVMKYDFAHRDALQDFVEQYNDYNGRSGDEEGYTYSNIQRLVQPDMGNEYGEFGVAHPDQRGSYHHYDLAPPGVMGHFRGTYNSADPLELNTATGTTFETKPNSYVIEEIQSDAQKGKDQVGHLHQVHGTLFKAAVQKALELGADTVYLPTAKVIANERSEPAARFAPIYDQAVVKEGLKPLLKIPGVTSKLVNGYHEIDFTPEAKEHILNGPGQSTPGYASGGPVRGYANGGIVHQIPSVDEMRYALMMRSN